MKDTPKNKAVLRVRSDESVIAMPDGAEQFHAQLGEKTPTLSIKEAAMRTRNVVHTERLGHFAQVSMCR